MEVGEHAYCMIYLIKNYSKLIIFRIKDEPFIALAPKWMNIEEIRAEFSYFDLGGAPSELYEYINEGKEEIITSEDQIPDGYDGIPFTLGGFDELDNRLDFYAEQILEIYNTSFEEIIKLFDGIKVPTWREYPFWTHKFNIREVGLEELKERHEKDIRTLHQLKKMMGIMDRTFE